MAGCWDGVYKGEEKREMWHLNLGGTKTLQSIEYHAFDCGVVYKGSHEKVINIGCFSFRRNHFSSQKERYSDRIHIFYV